MKRRKANETAMTQLAQKKKRNKRSKLDMNDILVKKCVVHRVFVSFCFVTSHHIDKCPIKISSLCEYCKKVLTNKHKK